MSPCTCFLGSNLAGEQKLRACGRGSGCSRPGAERGLWKSPYFLSATSDERTVEPARGWTILPGGGASGSAGPPGQVRPAAPAHHRSRGRFCSACTHARTHSGGPGSSSCCTSGVLVPGAVSPGAKGPSLACPGFCCHRSVAASGLDTPVGLWHSHSLGPPSPGQAPDLNGHLRPQPLTCLQASLPATCQPARSIQAPALSLLSSGARILPGCCKAEARNPETRVRWACGPFLLKGFLGAYMCLEISTKYCAGVRNPQISRGTCLP